MSTIRTVCPKCRRWALIHDDDPTCDDCEAWELERGDHEPDPEPVSMTCSTWMTVAVVAAWAFPAVAALAAVIVGGGWLLARAVRRDPADVEWRTVTEHTRSMAVLGRVTR